MARSFQDALHELEHDDFAEKEQWRREALRYQGQCKAFKEAHAMLFKNMAGLTCKEQELRNLVAKLETKKVASETACSVLDGRQNLIDAVAELEAKKNRLETDCQIANATKANIEQRFDTLLTRCTELEAKTASLESLQNDAANK